MKITEAFKALEAPQEINQRDLENYLEEFYQDKNYLAKASLYKNALVTNQNINNELREAIQKDYEHRAKVLVNQLVKISGNTSFTDLEKHFANVQPGDLRQIIDKMREVAEAICYRCEHKLINNRASFDDAIKNATIDACTPGALTNMENILYSMSDSLYPKKYTYISNIANDYVREHKLAKRKGLEVHVTNELIYEVSPDYTVNPPLDIYARYRTDLTSEPTDEFKHHAQFKDHLNKHFTSRAGVHGFTSYLAPHYADKLPKLPKSGTFHMLENGNKTYEYEVIEAIAKDLELELSAIIAFSEEDESKPKSDTKLEYPFVYTQNYQEMLPLGVMFKLAREELIENPILQTTEQITTSAWDSKKKQIIQKIISTKFNIIEGPDAWYKMETTGEKNIEKLFDTNKIKNLTINNQHIEDYLHNYLDGKSDLSFNDALSALSLEHNSSIETDDICKRLFLLSDQMQSVSSEYFQNEENELLSLSDDELLRWTEFSASKDKMEYLAFSGNEKMFDRFIRVANISGDDIKKWKNQKRENLLFTAIRYGNIPMIEKLIDFGMDKDAQNHAGDTPLHYATFLNNPKAITTLLQKRVNADITNNNGFTPLHYSVLNNKAEATKALVKGGVNVNTTSISTNALPTGYAALHFAVEKNFPEMINILLEADEIDVNLQSAYSWYTPLHLCTFNSDPKTINALFASEKLDVNLQNRRGYTALYLAIKNQEVSAIEALVANKKVDVTIVDEDGNGPIHSAAFYGNVEVIEKLLAHEAIDVNLENNNGQTALDIVMERNNTEAIKALLERDADKAIIRLINKGAGYFKDSVEAWRSIKTIVDLLREDKRVSTITNVLKNDLSMARRQRLINFLTREEQKIVSKNRKTIFESVSKTLSWKEKQNNKHEDTNMWTKL